ncbi:hypothetical protein RN347_15645 [Halomonas sp. PAMB 3264]|nr:hypothetical protein [Halomonas sp. PAMB 3264]WNL42039.1 hypothetical protein RN347_15645 [Halomonas sp. PAMB 3264]
MIIISATPTSISRHTTGRVSQGVELSSALTGHLAREAPAWLAV